MAYQTTCCSRLAVSAEAAGVILPLATSARSLNLRRSLLSPDFPCAVAPRIAASAPARRASASPRASQSSADAATHPSATDSAESSEAAAREAAALEAAAARVITLSSRGEFERLMAEAKDKGQLAVVETTMSTLPNTQRIYDTLVETARMFPNAVFLRILADKGAELRVLAESMRCARVPSYVLFREGQRVHEDAGMDAERLRAELLYYSAEGPVLEVHSAEEYRALIETHANTDMLVVIEATLAFCGPCVRIHQTVLNLSHRMAGHAVFARFFGDSADCTRELIRDLGVLEAPTFLFYRRGELLGRYVGSGRGELVGEILKHQGVAVS
ncbi:hypothetical protein CLOM_g17036 [Closterium sp. NIES-68]|nr:hypothetical protein CLOM_g17036 [Closterium sp. NIES-68]GJP75642.1 hypothetical protein CLOP_g6070 [Closterium sp. NIES-67]